MEFDNVSVGPVLMDELFDDVFAPIARDGAAILEIQIRLQKAFAALAEMGEERYRRNARRHSALALERAKSGLAVESDRRRLAELVGRLGLND